MVFVVYVMKTMMANGICLINSSATAMIILNMVLLWPKFSALTNYDFRFDCWIMAICLFWLLNLRIPQKLIVSLWTFKKIPYIW